MSMKSERRRGRMCGRWNLVIPLRRQTVGIHVTIVAVLINWKGLFLFLSLFSLFLSSVVSSSKISTRKHPPGAKKQGEGGLCSQRQLPGVMQKLLGFLCSGGKTRPIDANRSIKSNGSPTSRGSKAIGGG